MNWRDDADSRVGRVDSKGNVVGPVRAHLEVAEERSAKAMTGRCSWFCGDFECPEACEEAER